ncbi:MAG TPA: zf-HC2 domain-containing protein [Herpetosiphonaceae bacterium]
MIDCTDLEPFLSDYADGIADERTRRIVERHVQLCSRCQQRVQAAHQVAQQLRRLPLLPAGMSSRVARFRRRLEQRAMHRPHRLEDYPFFVSALLASVLILGILLTFFYLGI